MDNCLKISVGSDVCNLAKFDKIQITETTNIKFPNNDRTLLQRWNIKCNDKNNNGAIQNFSRSTKTSSPTSDSGATNLPPFGDSFMYIETSSNNHGNGVCVNFERTYIIQNFKINFYYNRYPISTYNSLKSMGRFRIQSLLEENTWSTRYNRPEINRYSNSSTKWTLLSLNYSVENYGKN